MKKEQHKLCDGNVVVYTRPKVNTSYYHARVKLPEISKWKYFSTKTDDLEAAKEFALREYQKFQIKLENGYVLDTRRFRVVAEIAIKEMEQQLELGVGKVSYHDYIRKIGHFKEFFGNRYVNNITYEDLVDYDKQRTDRIGRKAAKSTINTHNAALARVFDVAVRNGWMHESQVPRLKNQGRKGERRPYFDQTEVKKLLKAMDKYVKVNTKSFPKGGVKKRTIMIRQFLRDYVQFVLYTGVRPGEETKHIKWKHITVRQHPDGNKYFHIIIPKGKRGRREIVAKAPVRRCLERLLDRFCSSYHSEYTLADDLSKVDEYVFRLDDRSEPKDLHGAFENLLESAGMLVNREGKRRSLYSLRHTYATSMLEAGTSVHQVAVAMGTSVQMLERHYSHLQVWRMAADFAGSPYHSAQARQKQLSKGKNTATRLSKNSKKKKGQSVDKKQTKVIESDLEIDELRGALNEDGAEVMNPSAPESAPES